LKCIAAWSLTKEDMSRLTAGKMKSLQGEKEKKNNIKKIRNKKKLDVMSCSLVEI
jgi:hypothetical protein